MAEITFKTPLTAQDILDSELYGILIQAKGERLPLKPEVIGQKLRAAEDFYERSLQIFFNEKRVASEPEDRGLALGTDYDVSEPAYPYQQDLFDADRWAWMQLNFRPVKRGSVSIFIQFPGSGKFEIPPEWIRLDDKYGRIQFLPLKGPAVVMFFNLSASLLSFLVSNRNIPQIVYVDYTAGFTSDKLLADHNDLLEGVRLLTTLFAFGILTNIRSQGMQSQSLSEDGLSRSQGLAGGKWGPYSGYIEQAIRNEKEIRARWQEQEQGVPALVVC